MTFKSPWHTKDAVIFQQNKSPKLQVKIPSWKNDFYAISFSNKYKINGHVNMILERSQINLEQKD